MVILEEAVWLKEQRDNGDIRGSSMIGGTHRMMASEVAVWLEEYRENDGIRGSSVVGGIQREWWHQR